MRHENKLLKHMADAVEAAGGAAVVAKRAGVSPQTINNYISGRTDATAGFLSVLSAMSGHPVGWFFGEHATSVAQEQRAPYGPAAATREGYVYLPLYDVRASAGKGALSESENAVDVLAFKEDWVRRELRARPEDLNLIYVEGDSMEPDLRAGDIVLLDHTDTHARREGVYVIRMDGALLVKQLQRLPGGVVKVISRNTVYEPFTVTVAQLEDPNGFAVVGRVVWACRRF